MEAIQLYRPLLPTIHEQPIHPHYQFNFIATPNHSKLEPPFIMADFPEDFYILPQRALAIFSTCAGLYPKRELLTPAPDPVVRTDVHGDVEKMAANLCNKFPDHAYDLRPPLTWYDLYQYFDAVDLWIDGPRFYYLVLYEIYNRMEAHRIDAHAQIHAFSKAWVAEHLDYLRNIPRGFNPVWDHPDFRQGSYQMDGIKPREILKLSEAILYYLEEARRVFFAEERRPIVPYQIQPPQYIQSQGINIYPSRQIHVGALGVDQGGWQGIAQQRPSYGFINSMDTRLGFNEVIPYTINENIPASKLRSRGWSNESNLQAGRFSHQDRRDNPRHATPLRQSGNKDTVYAIHNPTKRNISDPVHYDSSGNQGSSIGQCVGAPGNQLKHGLLNGTRHFSGASAVRNTGAPHLLQSNTSPSFMHEEESIQSRHVPQALGISRIGRVELNYHSNGNICYTYEGDWKGKSLELQHKRTLIVKNIDISWHSTHQLKHMMSECGQVVSITYTMTGHTDKAFVEFRESSSMEAAVKRFNGFHITSEISLEVLKILKRAPRSSSSKGLGSLAPSLPASRRTSLRDRSVPIAGSHARNKCGALDTSEMDLSARGTVAPLQLPLSNIENIPSMRRKKQEFQQNNPQLKRNHKNKNSSVKSVQPIKEVKSKKNIVFSQISSSQPHPTNNTHRPKSSSQPIDSVELQTRTQYEIVRVKKSGKHTLPLDTSEAKLKCKNFVKDNSTNLPGTLEQSATSLPSYPMVQKGHRATHKIVRSSKSDGGYPESSDASFISAISVDGSSSFSGMEKNNKSAITNTSCRRGSNKKSNSALLDTSGVFMFDKFDSRNANTHLEIIGNLKGCDFALEKNVPVSTFSAKENLVASKNQPRQHSKMKSSSSVTSDLSSQKADTSMRTASMDPPNFNVTKHDADIPNLDQESIKTFLEVTEYPGGGGDLSFNNPTDHGVLESDTATKSKEEHDQLVSVSTTVTTQIDKKMRQAPIVAVPRSFLPRSQS